MNIHVRELARHLRQRGHEVFILAPTDDLVHDDITPLGKSIKVPFNKGISRPAIGPTSVAKVQAALRRIQPDIVHIHEPLVPAVSLTASLVSRVPIVVTFHSGADSPTLKKVRSSLRLLRWRFTVAIAVSDYAAQIVERFVKNVRVIPNGVETSLYKKIAAPKGQTVLFFGRVEARKGPQFLVAALPHLFKLVPNAKVIIAGEGPLKAELMASTLPKYSKNVIFEGAFDDRKRVELLSRATVVCLPAHGESFGYTLVEAMAAGRAVVASDDPGYQCVAENGKDAILLPVEDPLKLAQALAQVLNDPKYAISLGKQARLSAARYDWSIVTKQLESVYNEAISKHSQKRRLLGLVKASHEDY